MSYGKYHKKILKHFFSPSLSAKERYWLYLGPIKRKRKSVNQGNSDKMSNWTEMGKCTIRVEHG